MSQIRASEVNNIINQKQDTITTGTGDVELGFIRADSDINITGSTTLMKDNLLRNTCLTMELSSDSQFYRINATQGIYIQSRVSITSTTESNYGLYVPSGTGTYSIQNMAYFTIDFIGPPTSTAYIPFNDVCAVVRGQMIIGGSLVAIVSDKRIKTNIQDINDDNALQMIMKIEPKTYEYIDKFEKGNQRVYGFIAQQIKEVIPEAIKIATLVCPNIYKIGTLNNSNLITMDMDISDTINIGSNITLITSNVGKEEYKITSVNSNQFTIDKGIKDYDNLINSNIFVYGTKVNDFHILEKNYIYTLNVCATQELYKLIKQQNEQIQELEQNFELLSNMIQEQQLLIDALKPSS